MTLGNLDLFFFQKATTKSVGAVSDMTFKKFARGDPFLDGYYGGTEGGFPPLPADDVAVAEEEVASSSCIWDCPWVEEVVEASSVDPDR